VRVFEFCHGEFPHFFLTCRTNATLKRQKIAAAGDNVLLLVGILAAIVQQAPQNHAGSIEGMVTNSSAAPTPLAGALVKIRDSGPDGSQFSSDLTTDGAGRFSVQEVPPGSYVVEVSRDGYGYRFSMYSFSPTRSLPVTVAPGARTQVPPIALVAAGTVRGRVLDANGKGIAGAGVEILRLTNDEDGRRIWRSLSTIILTDGEGRYERTMLGPGDYYVRTILENGPLRIPVYHPETTEGGTAAPIALSEGAQITADIRVSSAPTTTHRISGRVIRPDSEAGKSAFVELIVLKNNPGGPVEEYRPLATSLTVLVRRTVNTTTTADGGQPFELRDIPSGRYDLVANAYIDGTEYSSRAEVYVGDGGAERVDLVLRPSVELKGRVTVEGELPTVRVLPDSPDGRRNQRRPQVGDVKLVLKRKDGLPLGISGPGVVRIDADGRSFSIRDVPEGDYELSALIESDGRPPGSNHYILDVRAGGRSVFDTGFRVGVDPVDSLEVVVGTQGGSIQGKIVGSQSALPAALVLVPESFRRSNASLYRIIYLPRNADFKMDGIAPGSYKLFAVPYLNDTVPYRSLEFIGRHESRAVSVTVQKGTALEGIQAPFLNLGR
jgi:hypothetical protein